MKRGEQAKLIRELETEHGYNGFNAGYGRSYLNDGHGSPMTDGERYDNQQGVEDGQRRRDISNELEQEGY